MGCCCSKSKPVPGGSGRRRRLAGVLHDEEEDVLLDMTNGYVKETLAAIRTLVDNDQETPAAMLRLHSIADQESGWLLLVRSMVTMIPIGNPLGPAVITLLLDDCPLPSKETIENVSKVFDLCEERAKMESETTEKRRNICIILGCIAEKMAGPSSIGLLNENTLDYLIYHLNDDMSPQAILFAIIALEKFAQTSENKLTIVKRLGTKSTNKLMVLEKWYNSNNFAKRQVGFCAQWCLDNLFICEGRPYSYESINNDNTNVMLNMQDVTEYLKLSPDGLQARCDATSFESVRCTFQVDSGVWYYEVTLITAGVMQIGWATKDSKFLNHEGFGVGDDEFSIAYDGCRQLLWYKADSIRNPHKSWQSGDVLGTILDIEANNVHFFLNGHVINPSMPLCDVFEHASKGFFAAASFMSFQQCEFNFGAKPYIFPPKKFQFQSFNDHATLGPDEKVVLPRHIKMQKLREVSVGEDCCSICFDEKATVILLPCRHRGLCEKCALQLTTCPMCRKQISDRRFIEESINEDT